MSISVSLDGSEIDLIISCLEGEKEICASWGFNVESKEWTDKNMESGYNTCNYIINKLSKAR